MFQTLAEIAQTNEHYVFINIYFILFLILLFKLKRLCLVTSYFKITLEYFINKTYFKFVTLPITSI